MDKENHHTKILGVSTRVNIASTDVICGTKKPFSITDSFPKQIFVSCDKQSLQSKLGTDCLQKLVGLECFEHHGIKTNFINI